MRRFWLASSLAALYHWYCVFRNRDWWHRRTSLVGWGLSTRPAVAVPVRRRQHGHGVRLPETGIRDSVVASQWNGFHSAIPFWIVSTISLSSCATAQHWQRNESVHQHTATAYSPIVSYWRKDKIYDSNSVNLTENSISVQNQKKNHCWQYSTVTTSNVCSWNS